MRRCLALAALLVALPAAADTPAGLQPLPDLPPPPGMPAEESLEPQVTITKRGEDRVEEFRINNRLYMMKVTPAHGGTPYYLVDEQGSGNFIRRDVADTGLRVPRWVIHTF